MNESQAIPITTAIAYCLWFLVGVTIIGTWVYLAAGHPRIGLAFGLTSGVIAPAAAVATVRCYFVRLSQLIRLTGGLERTQMTFGASDLHPVR